MAPPPAAPRERLASKRGGTLHPARLRALLLIPALAAVSGACGGPEETPEIRVGVLAILSGPGADGGLATVQGARLPVDRVNASGGLVLDGVAHRVVLSVEDDRGSPTDAIEAARRLINQESVVALVGLNRSGTALAVANLAENARVPMITTGATDTELTTGRRFVFSTTFDDAFQSRVVAGFVRSDLGARTAAVLFDIASPYNRNMAEDFRAELERLGGSVVAFQDYTTGATDFRESLRAIAAAGPDVLFLPNYRPDIDAQVAQAREVGVTATLVGADSWGPAPPGVAEGYYVNPWHVDSSDPRSRSAVAEYRAAYGADPVAAAMAAYDAMEILLRVMAEASSHDPEVLARRVAELPPQDGVSGRLVFDREGGALQSAAMIRIADGEASLYALVGPDRDPGPP